MTASRLRSTFSSSRLRSEMSVATPMTAVTKILLEKHPLTRPVAELLAGRVATRPAQGRES